MRASGRLLALAVTLTACTGTDAADPPAQEPLFTGSFTVIESPQHGPRACSMVGQSYPPQCGEGFELRGWSWDTVGGEESHDGVTWGDYGLTGTWDGTALTLTEPRPAPGVFPTASEDRDVELDTPCPTPPGGWVVIDGSRSYPDDLNAALVHASEASGFADSWLDRRLEPGEAGTDPPPDAIVNVRFTDDLATHEAALRRIWGGALCVSPAERSEQELLALITEIRAEYDVTASWTNTPENTAGIQVVVDDGVQERLDAAYGPGVVEVDALLRPVD
ncbi:hypothetical protein [Jiangella endophytica]|uniref:hypothetical protein n=1 Tax=Jiangella endophytica TaxID=1623398 RepID=UPI000E343FDE|nr:hypothetical protein [Jiangella endophytica]